MDLRLLLLSTFTYLIETHQALSESLSARDALRHVSDSYWAWKLREFPKFATDQGIHAYDETVEEFTLEAFERRKNACQEFLTQLDAIDRKSLTSAERQDHAVLRADLAYFVDGYRWRMYGALNPMNFLEGHHRMPSWLGKFYRTEEDFSSLMKRIEAHVEQINQIIALMKEAIRLKRTNHVTSMEGVINEVNGFLLRPANNSAFFIPFKKDRPDAISEEAMQGIRQRALDYINDEVYPVMRKLKTFLEEEYMHNTRPDIGVGSFDDGQDYYQACLRFHLSSNMTAAEVRDIGLSEVKRIKGLMEGVMRREGFNGTLSQFITYLREERYDDFYGLSDTGILSYYRNIVSNIIEPKLETAFDNIPQSTLRVEPMQRDGPSGSYSYGVFWVNLHRPADRPTFTMMALALHEANPGHHLQTIYAKELDLPDFRIHGAWSTKYYAVPFNFPWYTAYTEGWSLYAEYLGEEMGCYNESALELFGRYSSEIFRACRLVVDTGIHAFNMSLDEAMQYMADHTVIPQEQIRTEIHRYITWPGQACAYKIGELEILRMRRKAEKMLGDNFDVAEFNDQVLRTSRVPLYVLDDVVSEWIDSKMALVGFVESAASNLHFGSSGGVIIQLILSIFMFAHIGVLSCE